MYRSTVFKNNRTQALRVPKAIAFADEVTHVDIVPQSGGNLLIIPVRQKMSWDEFFKLPRLDADFMLDREQPPMQERNWDPE